MVGIDLGRPNLAACIVGAADIQVADGCAYRCAALRNLLREAFGDFGGEVAAAFIVRVLPSRWQASDTVAVTGR